MPENPHILFILADQHRHDALSVADCTHLQTPNLDRLCAQGVRFTHCYSPAPLCVPARAAILSGLYPHQTGVYSNRDSLDDARYPTFGRLLTEAGYEVHAVGRTHHMVHGCRFTRVLLGRSWPNPYGGPYGGRTLGKSPVELDDYWDVRIARATVTRLRQAVASGRPACVWANLQMPHPPFVLPEPFYSRAEALAETIEPPKPPPGFFDSRPEAQRRFWQKQLAHIPDDHLRRMQAYYYVSCELADYAAGIILDGLAELGLEDDTLVIYSADHGDLAGDHGLFSKGCTLYDGEARVPLICRWPRRIDAGTVSTHLVSLVDIGASILEGPRAQACALAHESSPPSPSSAYSARSLWPALRGEIPPRQHLIAVTGSPGGGHLGFMIRDRRWKLCVYRDGAGEPHGGKPHGGEPHGGELYDLETDPGETANRFDDPAARAVRDALSAQLLQEMIGTVAPAHRLDGPARDAEIARLEQDMETLESDGHHESYPLEQADPDQITRF